MSLIADDVIAYPFAEEVGLDVDPRYRELRQRGPVRVQLPYGDECWLATSYEDVRAVHGDRRFGKTLGVGKVLPRRQRVVLDPSQLANMDPPRHTRIRKLATPAFAKPRIRDLRGWVEGLVDDVLDEMVASGPGVDFSTTMAWTLPNEVMTAILGVRRGDIPQFRGLLDTMLSSQSDAEAKAAAMASMRTYVAGLVAERRAQRSDDLLSDLVHARDDEDRLTEDELVMLTMNLFLGGFETTMGQLGATVFVLLSQRHLWEELIADRRVFAAAMEELWRWIPTMRYGAPLPRWASEDVELSNGVVIRAGDVIIGERSVANRDETVFPHGWEIDFHRVEPASHLALGWGVHHCIGAHLAQLEIEVTVEKLLDRLPTLELAVPADEIVWSKQSMLRSVEALPVAW